MMLNPKLLLFSFLFAVLHVSLVYSAHSAEEWKTRTIYQLLTDRFSRSNNDRSPCNNLSNYCGGTFQGIIDQLPYIVGMGFDAIWISPIVANTPGGYHGYWLQNLTEINSNFGSANDLKKLVQASHAAGVWVMVDVVFNHVGSTNSFSQISPFDSAEYYHGCSGCPSNCAISNYNCFAPEVQNCRLAGLPDLDQSNPFVQSSFTKWLKTIISEYDFDGFRVDTVPEVLPSFWPVFHSAVGNTYAVGEVFSDLTCVTNYAQNYIPTLSYPLFFQMRSIFSQQADFNSWSQLMTSWLSLNPPQYEATFLDNHDNARFLNQNNDLVAYKAALTLQLMTVGIPIVYYGTEQAFTGGNDPNNREPLWSSSFNQNSPLYLFLKTVVGYRKSAGVANYPQVQRYVDSQFFAFTRGNTFVAVTNQKQEITRQITFHPFAEGTKLCNLFYPTQDCVVVKNKQFTVYLEGGESKILSPVS
eukprot:TRINITY_DN4000_c0_g1_i1.p1 TRINITY_DN4000_c0_g1~~TRINITY_DN4000_c0_g1_i1.p1  ORF type:complete len:470 (-),score=82.76 TRINITY_DN4000_c0_g1_i1:211-1620(-)